MFTARVNQPLHAGPGGKEDYQRGSILARTSFGTLYRAHFF